MKYRKECEDCVQCKWYYRHLVPLVSRLPDGALRWLHRRWPLCVDSDGWSLWLDASYERYCRSRR